MQLDLYENKRLIISLYDYTGKWAQPYIDAGYAVMLWDKKIEGDILEGFSYLLMQIEEAMEAGYIPHGILAAPPCTDLSCSGARWWPEKDKPKPGYEPFDCETELSEALILIVLHLVDIYKEFLKFWGLENPKGRIERLIPELAFFRKMKFNPCDFGDPYTKETILWGEFNTNLKRTPVEPVMYELNGKKGSWMWAKLGGKSERTKALRSATPPGFARAFFNANQ